MVALRGGGVERGGSTVGHGIRGGKAKKSRFCRVFHFGRGLLRRPPAHQVQNADSSGAPMRWGPSVLSAFHRVSVLLSCHQVEVGKVGFLLQALELFGDDRG